jgi:hypothetical protein
MFYAPEPVSSSTEVVKSSCHALLFRTCFKRNLGRRVPFSCFALPESFSTVLKASSPVFMVCALGGIFNGTEGVSSYLHVLRSWTRFGRYRGRQVPFSCFALSDSFWAIPKTPGPFFMFCAPRLVFNGTEGIGSRFHVLRIRTHFGRYPRRRVPFSSFALPNTFWAVPYSFSALPNSSCFHVLRSHTRFRRN